MLPEVLRHRDLLAPGTGWRAFFEVPGPRGGIVDLVWVRFSRTALANRPLGGGAVTDMTSIRALRAICNKVPGEKLASYTGVSRGHLTRKILPQLREAQWLQKDGDEWVPVRQYRPVVTSVVTVELKRHDWRTALKQASRHSAASDASWVVLDTKRSSAAISAAASFSHAGVGLCGLTTKCDNCRDEERKLSIFRHASQNKSVDVTDRAFFGEQCFALLRQGSYSGPERTIFGRNV